METQINQANRLLHEIQSNLQKLEMNLRNNEISIRIESEIQSHMDQVNAFYERLSIMAAKEPPTNRANAKMRVNQLNYDCQHLQAGLRQLQHKRYQFEREEQAREDLLHTNFAPNDVATTILIDQQMEEHNRLTQVNRRMDEILIAGSDIHQNLQDQGSIVKNFHKKLVDGMNTLGLSNTVMRLIERRAIQDKAIFWTLVVITCVIMFCVWRYIS